MWQSSTVVYLHVTFHIEHPSLCLGNTGSNDHYASVIKHFQEGDQNFQGRTKIPGKLVRPDQNFQ